MLCTPITYCLVNGEQAHIGRKKMLIVEPTFRFMIIMIDKFHVVLNFKQLFLKFNQFIGNWHSVIPVHCK